MNKRCPFCKQTYQRTYEEHTGSPVHRNHIAKSVGRYQPRG